MSDELRWIHLDEERSAVDCALQPAYLATPFLVVTHMQPPVYQLLLHLLATKGNLPRFLPRQGESTFPRLAGSHFVFFASAAKEG